MAYYQAVGHPEEPPVVISKEPEFVFGYTAPARPVSLEKPGLYILGILAFEQPYTTGCTVSNATILDTLNPVNQARYYVAFKTNGNSVVSVSNMGGSNSYYTYARFELGAYENVTRIYNNITNTASATVTYKYTGSETCLIYSDSKYGATSGRNADYSFHNDSWATPNICVGPSGVEGWATANSTQSAVTFASVVGYELS